MARWRGQLAITIMNNIEQEKQRISKELAGLLDSFVSDCRGKDKAIKENRRDEVLKKINQLYYLNLSQLENIPTLSIKDKEEVEAAILEDYKKSIMRIMLLSKQA